MAVVAETPKDTAMELEERGEALTAHIQELESEIGGLRADVAARMLDEPDAHESGKAKDSLRKATARLRTAREDLEHVQLAQVEFGRREVARLAREDRERREAAVAKAHALQDDRDQAAERVDGAFTEAVAALEAWLEVCLEQRGAFASAEMDAVAKAALLPGIVVEGAFVRALRGSRVPLGRFGIFAELPAISPRFVQPLVDGDVDMRKHQLPAEGVAANGH